MPKPKRSKYYWPAVIFLLILSLGLGLGWVSFRGTPLSYIDLVLFGIGVISFLWIPIWMRLVDTSTHSLLVPYAPGFVVALIVFISSEFGLMSDYDQKNLLVLFFSGYLTPLPITSILGQIVGRDLFLPQARKSKR